MKKLLCLLIVLLLTLTVFVACGDSEESTAPASSQSTPTSSTPADSSEAPADSSQAPVDSSSTPADSSQDPVDSSSTPVDSSSTSDEPSTPDEPDTPDTPTEPTEPTVDADSIDLFAVKDGMLGDFAIEDHHSELSNHPAFVFYIDDATIYQDILGTDVDTSNWSNPKYQWILTVNGEELIPAKFTVYDGGEWGYFRCDLGPIEDYDYVNKKFSYEIDLIIVDVATNKVKYFANFSEEIGALVHNVGMIEDESKPEGITAITGVTAVSGPGENSSEGYKMAFDGEIKTKLCTGDFGADHPVIATFGTAKTVKGISLVNANDNEGANGRTVIAFEIWVSEDGTNWGTSPAWSTDGAGIDKGDVSQNFLERYYGFDTPITANYVKFVFNNGEMYQISEIIFFEEEAGEPELDPRSQYLTVAQMAEITANETACQIKQHVGPTLDANGGFYVGISSDGNPFAAGTVEGTHGLGNTVLTKLYLNGEEIEITDGMYTTAAHWEIRIALDPAKLQAENEIVFALAAKDIENNNCNHDNYYCIFTVPKA